jgi:outer membrane protein
LSKDYRAKLEAQQLNYQKLLSEKDATLRSLKEQLDETNQAQLAIIYSKQEAVDSLERYFTKALQDSTKKYNQIVEQKVNDLVYKFGKEEGYDFIFSPANTNAFMYADSTLDITKEAVDYINKNIKAKTLNLKR